LKQEIQQYGAARDWSALQDQINSAPLMRAMDTASDLLGVFGALNDAYSRMQQSNRRKPGSDRFNQGLTNQDPKKEHTDEVPKSEDDTPDAAHLRTLQHEIAYDAKQLGISIETIGPLTTLGANPEQTLLDRLTNQVDVELARTTKTLTDAGFGPTSSASAPSSAATSQAGFQRELDLMNSMANGDVGCFNQLLNQRGGHP
jgi:hypothetical protein